MNWRLEFHRFGQHSILQTFPGGWRIQRFAKQLVKDHFFQVPYQQGKAWICPTQTLGRVLLEKTAWEPALTRLIQACMESDYDFVDVGANIGLHTLTAAWARKTQTQRVVAFEPEPICFEMLKRNLKVNRLHDVEAHNIGLGAKEEKLVLNVSTTGNKGNHTFLNRESTKPGPIVQILKLDGALGDRDWSKRPVLLKIDVEGFEPNVLSGGSEWLKGLKDAAVLCEVFPDLLKLQEASPAVLDELLLNAGFLESFRIEDHQAENGECNFWNQLYIKGQAGRVFQGPVADVLVSK